MITNSDLSHARAQILLAKGGLDSSDPGDELYDIFADWYTEAIAEYIRLIAIKIGRPF